MKEKTMKKSRYITGIDGLRSLAVVGVILYHLVPTTMRGGYLGVPIFFVISGYLITDLLRQEWQRTQTIDIKKFYYRRMKRLYPALVALLMGSSFYITLFQRNLLNNLPVVCCILITGGKLSKGSRILIVLRMSHLLRTYGPWLLKARTI